VDILAATFSLFVVNVAVPALLGLVFIAQVNIAKSFDYGNRFAEGKSTREKGTRERNDAV
jgi:hypothetical protein